MRCSLLFFAGWLLLSGRPALAQCTETPEAKEYAEKTRTQDAQGCSQCAALAVYLCSASYCATETDKARMSQMIDACEFNIRQMGQPYCCPELLGRKSSLQWGSKASSKAGGSTGSSGARGNPLAGMGSSGGAGSKEIAIATLAVGAISIANTLITNSAEKKARLAAEAAAVEEAQRKQRYAEGSRLLAASKAALTPPKGGSVPVDALRNASRAYLLLGERQQATAYETKLVQHYERQARAKGAAPRALLAAGDAHARAVTGQPDYARQLYWYRRALAAGHPAAITQIADVYTNRPVPLGDSAVAALRQAAEQGNVAAMMKLGEWGKGLTEPEKDKLYYIHRYGIKDKSVSSIESMKWYGQVMATDDEQKGQALLAVGDMYRHGLLDRKDQTKAQEYYESVARLAAAGVPVPARPDALRKLYPTKTTLTMAYRTYRRHLAYHQAAALAAQRLAELHGRGGGLFGPRANPQEAKKWSDLLLQYQALVSGGLQKTTTELGKLCKCE